jgi:hypothetical protein
MTTEMRVAGSTLEQRKVLLVNGSDVVLAHNHSDTGPAIPIIASLLLESQVARGFIAGTRLFDVLAQLNTLMQQSVPGWRMRITNRRRYAFLSNGEKRVTGRFFVDYFGVDRKSCGKRQPRCRFDVMNLDLLREQPPQDPSEQMEMALALLEMCDHRGITFKGTRGGLGNSMLKQSPYWEQGRIGAPKFINDKARPYLPGNFYALSSKVEDSRGVSAIPHCYYIDQTSSHHTIASEVALPHPQHLHARGRWKTLSGKWCTPDSPTGQALMGGRHTGIMLCKVMTTTVPRSEQHLYPPWALESGTKYVWIWTPELRLLPDRRIQVEYILASFTATAYDMVLPEYASWAMGEISLNSKRASYKKGSLLAAYGMLAFNGAGKSIYRYWGGVNSRPKCEIPMAGVVSESKVSIPDTVQLSTVNVVARGIIEAETRTRSIEYARELQSQGLHVPQIYADGLLVETDSLPLVPSGWRISHSLTNVHIPRSNAIISDQIVKLPGVGKDERDQEWQRLREESHLIINPDDRTPVELVPICT